MPPSPVEIVFVGANDQTPTSPHVPACRPFQSAPWACAQSSIRMIPSLRQSSAIRSASKARWPPMWTRKTARGLCSCTLRSRSSNDMQRSSRLQSTNSTRAPALIAASGRRHERVRRAEHGLAADAGPFERGERGAGPAVERDGASTPFQRAQALSNSVVSAPSDQRSDVEHALPERVQPRAVALVEADRKAREIRRDAGGEHREQAYSAARQAPRLSS